MNLMGAANQFEAVRANMEKRAPRFADDPERLASITSRTWATVIP